jgi:hypothetical protein
MKCKRLESNYSSCTGVWAVKIYVAAAVEALRTKGKTG